MDITKLMIGDWVWCGSNYGKVAEIFILHDSLLITVNNRRNKYFEEVNPFEVTTGAEDIRPIPLTTEILEKNGFEGSPTGDLYIEMNLYDKYAIELFPSEGSLLLRITDKTNKYSTGCNKINMYIKYLHQLQHALELCGIEKEITL